MFSDVLLTVDFDLTLTGPNGKIPERNLQAIEYFMANGGHFTVNTGRSTATFWKYLDVIPVNAPFLLYNGSAAYQNGQLSQVCPIDLDVWQTMEEVLHRFPELSLEIQGLDVHYLIKTNEKMLELYDALQWRYRHAQWGQDVGPFVKFSLFGDPSKPVVSNLFTGTEDELRRFDEAESWLRQRYADKVEVFRAAPRILDVHAKGVSKIRAARQLQARLGKKLLVCVGDAENDLPMLEGADYAFSPSDSAMAKRFPNACPCDEGAIADVIYEKIPAILKG